MTEIIDVTPRLNFAPKKQTGYISPPDSWVDDVGCHWACAKTFYDLFYLDYNPDALKHSRLIGEAHSARPAARQTYIEIHSVNYDIKSCTTRRTVDLRDTKGVFHTLPMFRIGWGWLRDALTNRRMIYLTFTLIS